MMTKTYAVSFRQFLKQRLYFNWPIKHFNSFSKLSNTFNSLAEKLDNTDTLSNNFINIFSHKFYQADESHPSEGNGIEGTAKEIFKAYKKENNIKPKTEKFRS